MDSRQIPTPADKSGEPFEKSSLRDLIFDWIEVFAIALAILLTILTFFCRYAPVEGDSMKNTLHNGDMLLLSPAFYTPKSGDVVVVQSKNYGYEWPLVKRVIAVGGQTVTINYETWEVQVDGKMLDESYVLQEKDMMMNGSDYLVTENRISTFTVPEGKLFVMGDNRNGSHDSRRSGVGMPDERDVIGKVFLRIFPFRDFGVVN